MSDTITLTKQQKKFVDQFLRHGIFKSKSAKQANADIKAGYTAYLAALAALDAELQGVAAPHDAAAQAARTAAESDHKAGNFGGALTKVTAAHGALTQTKAALVRHTQLDAEVTGFVLPAWGVGPQHAALAAEIAKARKVLGPPVTLLPDALDAAKAALDAAKALRAQGEKPHRRREWLLAEATRLTGPASADAKDKAAIKARRDAVAAALPNDPPAPAEVEAAERALEALRRVVDRVGGLDALVTARPAAGAAAKGAFAAFATVLDAAAITDITPKVLADATDASADAKAAVQPLRDALKVAQDAAAVTGLPGPEKQQRLAAFEAARTALKAAEADAAKKEAIRQAAFGQDALTRAVSHGPLAAETGRPFSDATAESLLKAFKDDPEVAEAATRAAAQSAFPDEVGARAGWAVQQAKSGFKANGQFFTDPGWSRNYAGKLLQACGDLGPEYGAGLDAYVVSGGHLEDDPLNEDAIGTLDELAQNRANAVAGAIMDPSTGRIDLASPGARTTLGHVLYNPNVLSNPLPGFMGHVMGTAKLMGDDATRGKAETLLGGLKAPQPGAAATLVKRSLGKGDADPAGADDTRLAVMTAMLTPIRQGSVGSCFATGPVVRQRALQPLDAMASMAHIAETGRYRPKEGLEVPAVTKLPDDVNPLTRSLEYSVAVAMARANGSAEKTQLDNAMKGGIDTFKDASGKGKAWRNSKAKLRAAVSAAFTLTYDPVIQTALSADGSSSQGRFVLLRVSDGKEIVTEAEFTAAIADLAVTTLAPLTQQQETDIRAAAAGPAFAAAVGANDYKPWEMPGGGQLDTPYKVVYGKAATMESILPKPPKTAAPVPEAERAAGVLAAMVKSFGATPGAMETISTDSHVFNAMPQSPGLQALAKDGKYAANIKAALIDPGKALAAADLGLDRAAWMFEEEMDGAAARESDPALKAMIAEAMKAGRPAGALKPAALAKAVEDALAPYHDAVADREVADWAAAEDTPPDAAETAAQRGKELKEAKKQTLESLTSRLFADIRMPEVTVADTNWGDAEGATLFVMAADPVTGDLALWQKTVPPGTMARMERDWLDSDWDLMRS